MTDEPGPNALVAKRSGHIVVVTSDLAREFSRTELEAVLAHCLVRIATDKVGTAQVGLALGPLGAGLRGVTGVAEDVATAGLTRYPARPGICDREMRATQRQIRGPVVRRRWSLARPRRPANSGPQDL